MPDPTLDRLSPAINAITADATPASTPAAGTPPGTPQATQPVPGTSTVPVVTIPAGLEKFYKDGKLDNDALAKSYLEAEKTMRQAQGELATTKNALAAITASPTPAPGQPVPASSPAPTTEQQLQKFVADPAGYIAEVLQQESAPLAEQLTQAAFQTKHPEMKDPKFREAAKAWVLTLQPEVQELEHSLNGADFLMNQYKREHNIPVSSGASPMPNTESPTPTSTTSSSPRVFSRAKIRELIRTNPGEYARLESDISTAYGEGRVVA